MVHFGVPIYCGLCSYSVNSGKNGFTSERKEICLISPEGISTAQTGIVTSVKADNTSANGGLATKTKYGIHNKLVVRINL